LIVGILLMDTILLLDGMGEKLQGLLAFLGYAVVYPTGDTAPLSLFQGAEMDLIVLNEETYPEAEEVLNFLRVHPSTKEIPVIRMIRSGSDAGPAENMFNQEEVVFLPCSPGAIASKAAVLLRVRKLRGQHDEDATLRERNAMLQDINSRYTRELQEANSIQQALLPAALPRGEDYQVSAWYRPMEQVGGDAYFTRVTPNGIVQIVVIDVTGHGIAAALLCSMVKLALSVVSADHAADILGQVNKILTPQLPDGRFISIVVATYNVATFEVQLAHGGIPPSVLVERSKGMCQVVGNKGFPIGVDEDVTYAPFDLKMSQGDILLLTTDGLTESANRDGERYGIERLGFTLADSTDLDRRGVGPVLEQDLIMFLDGKRLSDDVTVVSLRRL
jgi:serine phosphatase RsbU (regulator of sigma subunit)